MMTKEQAPWIDYLDIDEETGERFLKDDTPDDIRKKYADHLSKMNSDKCVEK